MSLVGVLLSIVMIWDSAKHSAFTDLIYFHEAFFCAFREADEHAGGENGKIRILRSIDGSTWVSVALLSKEGIDLRDPKFSIKPDGSLMLSLGGSTYRQEECIARSPHVSFSKDGTHWQEIIDLNMPGEWIWGVSWHQGIGYGASYRFTDLADIDKPWILTLMKTQDGVHYTPVTELNVPDFPSEAALRFKTDGTMVALVRRDGNGWIGSAKPPYKQWNWNETSTRLGGPNFVILPDGSMWAGSRYQRKSTAVGPMTLKDYCPEIVFPSGGDTGYPGMVVKDNVLYVSYYSSHEGDSKIYLAKISLARIQD